jgi:Patatin-like phospholipase
MSQRVENEGAYAYEPPYLFRSYDHHPNVSKETHEARNLLELNPGYAHRIPIWQVARATSAAPTYFNAITIDDHKFLDGGFGTNNPAEEIYREVCQMNGNNKSSVGLLVSIGTGQSKMSRFATATGSLSKYLTFLRAAKQMAVDGEKVHQRMQNDNLPTPENGPRRYYRFNVPYTRAKQPNTEAEEPARRPRTKPLGDMALDEWKTESKVFQRSCNTTLRDIKAATEAYLSDPKVQVDFDKVARLLVTARRERCRTEDWELVSTGTQYRCVYTQCHSLQSQKMRARETSLRNHLKHIHELKGEEIDKYVELGRCPS